jgi:tetratricopeptide (TPR) repeat protein
MSAPKIHLQLQHAVGLHRSGQLDEAVRAYKKVLRKDARAVGALNLLGLAEFQLGHLPEAADALSRAARLNPDLPNVDFNLGRVLQAQGRLDEALTCYQRAVARSPQDAEALTNLGTVLSALTRYDEAIAVYRRAAALAPRSPDIWHNLGNAYRAADKYDDAVTAYRSDLALRPDHVPALDSMSCLLYRLGRYEEASEASQHLVAVDPGNLDHHNNLANALSCLGRDDEALSAYDRALALDPTAAVPLYDKGAFLLSRGRFAEGWPLFASRWKVPANASKWRDYRGPRWAGDKVDGTLLVWAEQGLGDQVLMCSMVPELRAYASKVVLEVEPRLVRLLQRSFPDISVIAQEPQLYDGPIAAHCPLGDLPQYLRPDAGSFERAASSYLAADQGVAADLRRRLTGDGRRVIGLSWASVHPQYGGTKSARLADLAPLMSLSNCRFVDLQYGDTRSDREQVARESGLMVEHLDNVDNTNDIDRLTALMAACDAIVTVSNTNAHLAAAQGKPTFILLSDGTALIWYWMKRGPSTPFYASARLFRKGHTQSWSDLTATAVAPAVSSCLDRQTA